MPFRSRSVVSIVASTVISLPVLAQDGSHGRGHAENHDWYQELKQPGTGYSCCNGSVNGVEGDHILLAPPFIVAPEHLDLIVARLAAAIDAAIASIASH